MKNLQARLPAGDEDGKIFPTLVAHLFICLHLGDKSAYLVVGQIELLDLLVGDALGENIDALVSEDVVGEVEHIEIDKLVHTYVDDRDSEESEDLEEVVLTGHHIVQQCVCQLAVPVGNFMSRQLNNDDDY